MKKDLKDHLIIGPPNENDLKELHRLFERVLPHTFLKEGLPSDHMAILEEVEDKKEQLEAYFNKSQVSEYLVARVDDQIVGTIWYGRSGNLIKEGSNGQLSNLGEIGTVFVLPDYQGCGIGKKLFLAMEDLLHSKQIEKYTLDSGYTHAQEVWKHLLGAPAYIMKDKWGQGIDHYIWLIEKAWQK